MGERPGLDQGSGAHPGDRDWRRRRQPDFLEESGTAEQLLWNVLSRHLCAAYGASANSHPQLLSAGNSWGSGGSDW